MILAVSPWIIGCAIVLTGVARAPSPAPPLDAVAVGEDEFGLLVAAEAAGAAARASTAMIGSSRRDRRKKFSFLGRRGWLLGWRKKRPRLPRLHRGISPWGRVGPPLRGYSGRGLGEAEYTGSIDRLAPKQGSGGMKPTADGHKTRAIAPALATPCLDNVRTTMRSRALSMLGVCVVLTGCGGATKLLSGSSSSTTSPGSSPTAARTPAQLGFPSLATKNTTRVAGADPTADAAGVALAVYPSAVPGTHPAAVTLAPTDDWQAAVAAAALMAPPILAPAQSPAYAMPAAGWAAESGDPVLFVSAGGIPEPTRQALLSHQHPHIYVLGPPSVISDHLLAQLRQYGSVKRVGAQDPAANSVAFAEYRDPACQYGQPCAHVPGSFGWAMRSPGHGYVLLNAARPLDAAASAALSGSGDYGPQLLINDPAKLPGSVLNFFLDYATPGYTQEGPTAAVYNHGWVIGAPDTISVSVQAEMDSLLEAVPQSSK